MNVVVTGGSGRIESYVVRELRSHAHEVLNADSVAPSDNPARYLRVGLSEPEQVYHVFAQAHSPRGRFRAPAATTGAASASVHGQERGLRRSPLFSTASKEADRRHLPGRIRAVPQWHCEDDRSGLGGGGEGTALNLARIRRSPASLRSEAWAAVAAFPPVPTTPGAWTRRGRWRRRTRRVRGRVRQQGWYRPQQRTRSDAAGRGSDALPLTTRAAWTIIAAVRAGAIACRLMKSPKPLRSSLRWLVRCRGVRTYGSSEAPARGRVVYFVT